MARYEFIEGGSSKFWEIELTGSSFTVRFGRIGTQGQTQLKSFATAELARKEHDKLVAEKVKKGYREAAGGGAPAAPPPAPAAAKAVKPLRQDVYIYNEATGFIITSQKLRGKGWDSLGEEWNRAVRAGQLIAIELYQDDPFVIRVVVGGELEPAEDEEWTGRMDWKLSVPDGNLVICGGSPYVEEEFDDPAEAGVAEYFQTLKIPKGEYRASVRFYLGGVNGDPCLKAARGGDEPEPLGEWFRRTRPGVPFPAWLHNDCVSDPAEDPGHEDEWKEKARIEDPVEEYVQFLLHLTPLEQSTDVAMPELGDGWFSSPSAVQEPARCPLGIPAKDVLRHPKPAACAPTAVEVAPHTARFPLRPVSGTVTLPVADLVSLFRLAWFGHIWSFPAVFVTPPAGHPLPSLGEPIDGVICTAEGGRLAIGLASSGYQTGTVTALGAVGPRLAALPDGTKIELETWYGHENNRDRDPPVGVHRHAGTVTNGVLSLTHSYPVSDGAQLTAALALARQVDHETSIDAGSEAAAESVMPALKEHGFFSDNPPVRTGSRIGTTRPEPLMLNYIASEVFHALFGTVFPTLQEYLREDEDEEDEPEEDPGEALAKQAAARGITLPPRLAEVHRGADKRVYHHSDVKQLDAETLEAVGECEKHLAPLGFRHVADLVVSAMPHALIRAWAQDGGTAWASRISAPHGRGTFEFISYFEKDAGLATTTHGMVSDELYRNAYKTVCQNTPVSEMWKLHQERAAYLARTHGAARPVVATPAGLAADVEDSIVRQEKKKPAKGRTLVASGTDGRQFYHGDARLVHPLAPRLVDDADALMRTLGFAPVGDVIGTTYIPTYTVRGYVRPGGHTWAKLLLNASTAQPDLAWEFVTPLTGGGVLVTQRNAMSKDEPKRKIFRILDQKSPPPVLLEKHEKRLAELAKKGTPVAVDASLKGLALEVDAAIERIFG